MKLIFPQKSILFSLLVITSMMSSVSRGDDSSSIYSKINEVTQVSPISTRSLGVVSPKGKYLAYLGTDGALKVQEIQSGKIIQSISMHTEFNETYAIKFSESGERLIAVLIKGRIPREQSSRVALDIPSGKYYVTPLENQAVEVYISKSGNSFVIYQPEFLIYNFDTTRNQLKLLYKDSVRNSWEVKVGLKCGNRECLTYRSQLNNKTYLVDVDNGTTFTNFRPEDFSAGDTLAGDKHVNDALATMRTASSLTENTSLYSIFDLSSLKKIVTIATPGPSLVTGTKEYFSNMIISKNKKLFLGATVSGNVRAFNEKGEDIIKQLSFGTMSADLVTISPDERYFIIHREGGFNIYEIPSNNQNKEARLVATVSPPRQSYIQEFTADSKFTLIGSFAGEVSIVNNQAGEVKVIQTSKGVASVAISALYMLDNGKQALTVSSDGEINVINIAAATSVIAKANVGRVFNSNSVSFDMETKTLVVSGDKSIQVFQLK